MTDVHPVLTPPMAVWHLYQCKCLVSYTVAACEDDVTGRITRCIERLYPGSFQGKRN